MRVAIAFALSALALAAPAHADEKAAQVSFLQGSALRTPSGTGMQEPLKKGSWVTVGDLIETGDATRLEVKLKDRSAVRLGANAKLKLNEAHFGGAEKATERKFSAKLFFGNLWVKAVAAVGGDNKFDVETDNAVAGVRGTAFRVDARSDKSVLVKVFAGAVAVAKNVPMYQEHEPGKGVRKQVKGPGQVDKKAWEKLVGKQMQVMIAADGTPGDPVAFDANEKDDFEAWNLGKDEKAE